MEHVTSKKAIQVLNDLIAINNDRIEGYQKAISELKPTDADLRALFTEFIDVSKKIKNELVSEVQSADEDYEKGTTNSGKLFRAWMDVKSVFTGHDRYSTLVNCERGEDAAQEAYRDALKEELPADVMTMLSAQQQQLKTGHDKVKRLRDNLKHN